MEKTGIWVFLFWFFSFSAAQYQFPSFQFPFGSGITRNTAKPQRQHFSPPSAFRKDPSRNTHYYPHQRGNPTGFHQSSSWTPSNSNNKPQFQNFKLPNGVRPRTEGNIARPVPMRSNNQPTYASNGFNVPPQFASPVAPKTTTRKPPMTNSFRKEYTPSAIIRNPSQRPNPPKISSASSVVIREEPFKSPPKNTENLKSFRTNDADSIQREHILPISIPAMSQKSVLTFSKVTDRKKPSENLQGITSNTFDPNTYGKIANQETIISDKSETSILRKPVHIETIEKTSFPGSISNPSFIKEAKKNPVLQINSDIVEDLSVSESQNHYIEHKKSDTVGSYDISSLDIEPKPTKASSFNTGSVSLFDSQPDLSFTNAKITAQVSSKIFTHSSPTIYTSSDIESKSKDEKKKLKETHQPKSEIEFSDVTEKIIPLMTYEESEKKSSSVSNSEKTEEKTGNKSTVLVNLNEYEAFMKWMTENRMKNEEKERVQEITTLETPTGEQDTTFRTKLLNFIPTTLPPTKPTTNKSTTTTFRPTAAKKNTILNLNSRNKFDSSKYLKRYRQRKISSKRGDTSYTSSTVSPLAKKPKFIIFNKSRRLNKWKPKKKSFSRLRIYQPSSDRQALKRSRSKVIEFLSTSSPKISHALIKSSFDNKELTSSRTMNLTTEPATLMPTTPPTDANFVTTMATDDLTIESESTTMVPLVQSDELSSHFTTIVPVNHILEINDSIPISTTIDHFADSITEMNEGNPDSTTTVPIVHDISEISSSTHPTTTVPADQYLSESDEPSVFSSTEINNFVTTDPIKVTRAIQSTTETQFTESLFTETEKSSTPQDGLLEDKEIESTAGIEHRDILRLSTTSPKDTIYEKETPKPETSGTSSYIFETNLDNIEESPRSSESRSIPSAPLIEGKFYPFPAINKPSPLFVIKPPEMEQPDPNVPDFLKFAIPMNQESIDESSIDTASDRKMDVSFGYAKSVVY